tara:strand:- start:606 stop:953 length:348 start_codon:yes stop_codon:yes gene_type:complete
MISSSLEWHDYVKSKGGYEYLMSEDYIRCVHDSSWGCSCSKKHRRERKKFKNMDKLLKWGVDLTNEPSWGTVLININNEEQVYLGLPSMKFRYKGTSEWMKLKLRPLKKIITNTI